MKKFLFSVALLLGGMAVASAQNLTPVGKFNERLRIIPKTFTVDKQAKAVAFTSEESEGAVETNSFTIFGKGFSVAWEFSYNNSNLLKEYTLVEYRTPEITARDTSEYDTTYDILLGLGKYNEVGEIDAFYQLSIDDCIAYIENRSGNIDSTYTDNDGCTYFITRYFSHDGISEKNYPERYYYLKDKMLYSVSVYYEVRYTGEWTSEETNVYYTSDSEIEDHVDYINADSESPTSDFSTILTQTLFNDDDKYEFFVTKRKVKKEETTNESDYDGDGINDHKETRYSAKITAVEIVSEDGSVLNSIPIEGDYFDDLSIYTFNGENYLALFTYGSEYYIQLYRIDKGSSSSLQKVAMPAGMKMFPTIARPSDEITIEFEASANNAVRTLSVTDAAGRTVEQRTVAPDATRTAVSARRLHAGTYIFTLTENGKQVDNGKIIVK